VVGEAVRAVGPAMEKEQLSNFVEDRGTCSKLLMLEIFPMSTILRIDNLRVQLYCVSAGFYE